MLTTRVMPCLLLKDAALVKTIQFKKPSYIGDPINAVNIYNEKQVDELIFLDITATVDRRPPQFDIIRQIASECFMPVAYGGGLKTIQDIKTVFSLGIEKICLNTQAVENPEFVRSAAQTFGSQSIIVSIDARKGRGGAYEVYTHGGRKRTRFNPVQLAMAAEQWGAGELLLTSIDRDGTMEGYDLTLTKQVTQSVGIPVVACGGAGKLEDFRSVVMDGGASAAACGSMVVYHGRNRAVLINFPKIDELRKIFE